MSLAKIGQKAFGYVAKAYQARVIADLKPYGETSTTARGGPAGTREEAERKMGLLVVPSYVTPPAWRAVPVVYRRFSGSRGARPPASPERHGLRRRLLPLSRSLAHHEPPLSPAMERAGLSVGLGGPLSALARSGLRYDDIKIEQSADVVKALARIPDDEKINR